jgi:outer membrane receptor protein involved in Fe transport
MSRLTKLSVLFPCLWLGIAAGQDITGTIVGTVTDASGAGVPSATVTVFNIGQNRNASVTTTDSAGNYTAALLPVGVYNVTVEAKGFRKATKSEIDLHVNDKLAINVSLEVGDVTETVTVREAPVHVETQNATQSTVISGTQIREEALITRSYEQLVGLMPGVTSASVDQLYVGVTIPSGATATIPFSINGQRNSGSVWLVDGADNIDRGSNLTLLNTPSIDSIEEFKVLRSNYSAESGRAGGAQISVVTKSGTNTFHGDLFEFVRNSDFAANNFYNNATSLNLGANGKSQVAPLHYNNFGWTLGGPIFIPGLYNKNKDKTFFFVSEEFRRVITYASGTAVLPTSGMLNGTFSTPVCVSYTGSTCNQTSTQINNIDPVARQYIKDIYSRLPLNAASTTVNSLFRNVYDFEQELYKIDHVFGPKLQVSARYLRDSIPTTEPQGLFTGSPVPGVAITSTNSPGHNWTAKAISAFTPTWLNELGYSYSFGAIISNPVGTINSTVSPDIKVTTPFPVTLTEVPTLAFTSGTSITGYGPYRDYNRNHNVFDNLTKIHGDHTFRFGATYNHYQKKENAALANAGSFTFTPASTPAGTATFNQAFANFLLGNVATFSQASEDVTPNIQAQQFELYAQDDWRVRPNFTLNFGVRYSNFRQPIDANHELTNFDPATYSSAQAAALTSGGLLAAPVPNPYLNGIIIAGQNSPYGSKISTQANLNFAPRFGFAWDPFGTGKTAIRGGYGIFFDSTLYGTFEQNIFANPPFVNSAVITNTTLDNPAGGTATVSNSPKDPHATPVNFPTPYSQQWNFEVQRQFAGTWQVNLAYVGSKATHLLGEVDLNELPPGLAYSSGLIAPGATITSANTPVLNLLRPYKGYASMVAIEPWFNSNYNALQIFGQKHFSGNSLIAFSYTWSKNLTDNQTDRSTAPQNLYNFNKGEYGPATLDRTQVFSANYVYTIPFFRQQKGLAGKVLGGWEAAGLVNYYTGLPYTATTSTVDPSGLGVIGASPASLRPDLVCNPNLGPKTRFEWFNIACLPSPAVGPHLPGNEGRGVIRGPGYDGWSLALSKNIEFRERYRFQLRGEASNVFNHTNPSTFGSLSNVSTLFGTVTGYRDPRIIQLGAKMYF